MRSRRDDRRRLSSHTFGTTTDTSLPETSIPVHTASNLIPAIIQYPVPHRPPIVEALPVPALTPAPPSAPRAPLHTQRAPPPRLAHAPHKHNPSALRNTAPVSVADPIAQDTRSAQTGRRTVPTSARLTPPPPFVHSFIDAPALRPTTQVRMLSRLAQQTSVS